mgnify:CR=1 FL=1
MSQESTVEAPRGLFARVRKALFGLPKRSSRFAHPWTAYSPANLQAKKTKEAAGHTLATFISKPVQPTTTDLVCQPVPTEVIKLVEVSSPNERGDAGRAFRLPAPVTLKLIESQPTQRPAAMPPALAAMTGQDFHLAARLRSVSMLNRVSKATEITPAAKSSRLNRPVAKVAAKKRQRQIEPPAVRRNNRSSAEVIQLRLALARAMFEQPRARKAA